MPLALRAALALSLMIAFYALALAAIAGLMWIGIHLVDVLLQAQRRAPFELVGIALVCFAGAGVILWSVLPRWDRFEAPGPEVTAAEYPALFAELRRAIEATGQPMPAHVYVAFDVNAFVAVRGGMMGLGSRRVMSLGLPLLRTLQVDELRAVIAHEMGHFHGGDTRLGPWIHKTRSAIARTHNNLERANAALASEKGFAGVFSALQAPFRWFTAVFMRASQAISRAQESSADALAVRIEGRRAVIDGLKKTHAAAIAHAVYQRNDVAPLIAMGVLPPVGAGFSTMLANEQLAKLLDGAVEKELAEARADPYDSHPSLRDRIDAAAQLAGPDHPPDPRRAIELVHDADAIEDREARDQAGAPLRSIAWSDSGALWLERWRRDLVDAGPALAGLTPATVPADPRAIRELLAKTIGELADRADEAQLRGWWISVVGSALGLLLADAGFTPVSAPGSQFRFTRGEVEIDPFDEVAELLDGTLPRAEWLERWTARGHAERSLG